MDSAAFSTSCDALSKTHKLEASNNEIPQYGNCITSVKYLIQKSSYAFLPRVWVGDLPRVLISHCWKLILINLLRCRGETFFFYGMKTIHIESYCDALSRESLWEKIWKKNQIFCSFYGNRKNKCKFC